MKKMFAALAVVVILLPPRHSTAVLANEKIMDVEPLIIEKILTGTGSVLLPLDPMTSSGAKAIWIYLKTQEAVLTESGVVVRTYRISSGAPSTPTPRGGFKIFKKEELRVSGQAVAYRMPNYMSFTKNSAFGLHALPYLGKSPESSGYWNEALSHIGVPVSHGCVRFLPEEATEIYAWAAVGIPVFIQN